MAVDFNTKYSNNHLSHMAEISRKGDGIARVQGFVIFVKDGNVGQKVKIHVNQVGDRFATATPVIPPSQ